MLKQFLNKSKQLELEDKIDEFLESRNLPHPRIEPDLINVEEDKEQFNQEVAKKFKVKKETLGDKLLINKSHEPMWIQRIEINNLSAIPGIIFYDNRNFENKSKDFSEYGYVHELSHLKQLLGSKTILKTYQNKLNKDEQTIFKTILEGFAEYVSSKIMPKTFFKRRKNNQYLSTINILLLNREEFYPQQITYLKKELRNLTNTIKGKSGEPYLLGYVLFETIDQIIYKSSNQNLKAKLGNKNLLYQLATNPLKENMQNKYLNNASENIEENPFIINKYELVEPYKFIERS